MSETSHQNLEGLKEQKEQKEQDLKPPIDVRHVRISQNDLVSVAGGKLRQDFRGQGYKAAQGSNYECRQEDQPRIQTHIDSFITDIDKNATKKNKFKH